ncbi:MAG: RlpA-like double-psi beta-barrel domain-containing protein [Patescibacteria group bacterium]
MTSLKKLSFAICAFLVIFLPIKVFAAEPTIIDVESDFAVRGREYKIGEEFTLGLRPDLFSSPARITITPEATLPLALPPRYEEAGKRYELVIDAADEGVMAADAMWLKVLSAPKAGTETVLLGFNFSKQIWEFLGRGADAQNFIKGSTKQLHTVIVAAADLFTVPGNFGSDLIVNSKTQVIDLSSQSVLNFKFENLQFTLPSSTISQNASLIVIPNVVSPLILPSRFKARTSYYQIALRQPGGIKIRPTAPITISPTLAKNGFFEQKVLIYNATHKTWETAIKNRVPNPESIFLIVDDLGEEQGIASWYSSKKYPDGVAHNRYPMGTKLKVTNIENNKSTIVKVVSRGPYIRGRVIDMVYTAFKKIKGKNGGVATVKVAVVDLKVLGETIAKTETQLNPVPTDVNSKEPIKLPISSTAGAVYDVDNKVFVAIKNSDEAHPIASLSKLMTALVYLDRKPTFRNKVTYQKSDSAICACLYVSPGETLTTKDLWNAMLIGSANNAVKALVRSTKLSEAEFVKLMNEKAKALGLNTLTFADPTGLDPANQGSAADMAKLAAIAFSRPEIANTTIKKSYTFSTLNTKRSHTITNRNQILTSGWQVTGTKTGYIEESGFCLIGQVKGKTTNRNLVVVTLGAQSKALHYTEMENSFSIGFANIQ